jgi:CheY-like chemotaxis protein
MDKPQALVIEDYADQAMVFGQALERAGFAVEIIMDGPQAQQRLAEAAPPDLLLLDLHVPRISGEALLRQIHADPRFAHTRLILATADALRAQVLSDQVDWVLLKPVSFFQLVHIAQQALRDWTSKPEAGDSQTADGG